MGAPPSEVNRERLLVLAGRFALALALASLSRIALEMIQISGPAPGWQYFGVIGLEGCLSAISGVTGWGLHRQRGWAIAATCATGASLIVDSSVTLALTAFDVVPILLVLSARQDPHLLAALGSRILIPALHVLFWPLVLGLLLLDADRPGRGRLGAAAAGAATLTGLMEFVLQSI